MPLIFPSFQCEQDIASHRNNTPQHFPTETNSKGADSTSTKYSLCLVYRAASTPRSYTSASQRPPQCQLRPKGLVGPQIWLPRTYATWQSSIFLKTQPRFRIDQAIVIIIIIIILQTTLTHPNPNTGVHDPHRTAAAAPYCRVLTVARSRNGWSVALIAPQQSKGENNSSRQSENASWHIRKLLLGPI